MSGDDRTYRVLTYSHDGYGLGHLRRNLRLIAGLLSRRPNVCVLAVTGCKVAHEFDYPPGVDYLRLPAVTKLSDSSYVADGLAISGDHVSSLRSSIIAAAADRFEPDVVLVDRHPLGLNGELADALRVLRVRHPATRVVLGLRDIIDAPAAVHAEWTAKGHTAAIDEFYDSVMVYGSQSVFDVVAEYELPASIASKLTFTGYLGLDEPAIVASRPLLRELDDPRSVALCTLGGGKDAFPVASAFLGAMRLLERDGWRGVLVTGPYMSDGDRSKLDAACPSAGVVIRRFVPDLAAHLGEAAAVLCMGGYNTLCEVLSVGAAAVVVPRATPRLEQLIRARVFEGRGLVRVVHPDALAPATVAEELQFAAVDDRELRLRAFDSLGRGGIARAAAHLDAMLGAADPRVPVNPTRALDLATAR